jgi:thiol-disulfide isomerase/thioredoxin
MKRTTQHSSKALAGGVLAAIALSSACAARSAAQKPATGSAPLARPAGAPTAAGAQLRAPRAVLNVPLTTLAGESLKLADLGGQVTVVAIWATWCKPCLQELPMLDAVKRRYADDPTVSVVAVSIDEVESEEDLGNVQAIVERLGVKLPVYVDQTGRLARHLMGGINSVPLLAILDRDLRMLRERGFDTSTNESAYVAAKSALIELARKGELPATTPGTPQDPETGALVAALRANLKRTYPELSDERIEELIADLEERMLDTKRRMRR